MFPSDAWNLLDAVFEERRYHAETRNDLQATAKFADGSTLDADPSARPGGFNLSALVQRMMNSA
jgi:hypothetical protein